MKMTIIVLLLALLTCSVIQAQTNQPFQPQPYGQQYQVPAQAYVPMRMYQTGPPQYQPMPQYGYQRPPCYYYPRPRGVWGIGPIPLGYYW